MAETIIQKRGTRIQIAGHSISVCMYRFLVPADMFISFQWRMWFSASCANRGGAIATRRRRKKTIGRANAFIALRPQPIPPPQLDILISCIAGVRGSMIIRVRPCMTLAYPPAPLVSCLPLGIAGVCAPPSNHPLVLWQAAWASTCTLRPGDAVGSGVFTGSPAPSTAIKAGR